MGWHDLVVRWGNMSLDDAIDFQNFSTYLFLKNKKLYNIVQLLACGYNAEEISRESGLSANTIGYHLKRLKNVYKKFENTNCR